MFTGNDFRLVDLTGTEVCRELPPGTSLDVLLQVEATSDLNFNTPFVAAYENRDIVTFNPKVYDLALICTPQPTK